MNQATLLEAADRFQQCIERRDRQTAERLLAADYALVLVHPEPAVMRRERWLDILADYVVHAYRIDHRHVDIGGNLAAVLQRVWMQATVLGDDRSGTLIISDIWRHGSMGWQLWKRHSSPLSAGRMPGA